MVGRECRKQSAPKPHRPGGAKRSDNTGAEGTEANGAGRRTEAIGKALSRRRKLDNEVRCAWPDARRANMRRPTAASLFSVRGRHPHGTRPRSPGRVGARRLGRARRQAGRDSTRPDSQKEQIQLQELESSDRLGWSSGSSPGSPWFPYRLPTGRLTDAGGVHVRVPWFPYRLPTGRLGIAC